MSFFYINLPGNLIIINYMMKKFKITSAAIMLALILSAGKCGKDQNENSEPPLEETSNDEVNNTDNQSDVPVNNDEGTKIEESNKNNNNNSMNSTEESSNKEKENNKKNKENTNIENKK